jgi:diamine N-acetyltransferase
MPAVLESPRMEIELREITFDSVRAVCSLDVADDQREFVAPNAVSIAEAHFVPQHWMRAIYVDGEPAGLVLTYEEPTSGTYDLWRFMVAGRYQGRGVGRRAMQLLLDRWRGVGATVASLSVVPTNSGAIAFYESLGFRLTGEEEHGELVMRLDLAPRS